MVPPGVQQHIEQHGLYVPARADAQVQQRGV
jgi:hypothetical protein